MSRVPTLASHTMLSARLIGTQSKMFDLQTQLSTEKKSQDYTGIAKDTMRLVNFENERSRTESFLTTNTVADTKLKAMSASIDGVRSSLNLFKQDLNDFASRDYTTMDAAKQSEFEAFQTRAFNVMKDMESYLDIKVNGEFLFSGGQSSTPPVSIPYTSKEEFQAVYDGNTVTAPESRSDHMNDTTLSSLDTGDLTFAATSATTGTITATTANAFNKITMAGVSSTMDSSTNQITAAPGTFSTAPNEITQGTLIKVSGSTAANDRFYTVDSVSPNGGTITVVPDLTDDVAVAANIDISVPNIQPGPMTLTGSNQNNRTYTVTDISANGLELTVTPAPTAETLTAPSGLEMSNDIYYQGGETVIKHRVDETHEIEFGINAKDGAIEKAFRAIGIAIQGLPTDSSGNFDASELSRRLDEALRIANDALEHNPADTSENTSDFSRLENLTASNEITLDRTMTRQQTYSSFLAIRITDLENCDTTEVATRITDEKNALEVSYAALSMINNLSLLNYMS